MLRATTRNPHACLLQLVVAVGFLFACGCGDGQARKENPPSDTKQSEWYRSGWSQGKTMAEQMVQSIERLRSTGNKGAISQLVDSWRDKASELESIYRTQEAEIRQQEAAAKKAGVEFTGNRTGMESVKGRYEGFMSVAGPYLR